MLWVLLLVMDTVAAMSTRNAPRANLPWAVAICVPALYGHLNPVALEAWTRYHRAMGFSHIFGYFIAGNQTDSATVSWLRTESGWQGVEAVPGCDSRVADKKTPYNCVQRFAMLKCFKKLEHRRIPWAWFGDVDEFFWVCRSSKPPSKAPRGCDGSGISGVHSRSSFARRGGGE